MGIAEIIVDGLGYAGKHFHVVEKLDDLWRLASAATVAKAATFNLSPEKRTTLDFALDHLAPRHEEKTIPLPAGAPFGALAVNKQTCTLCKACIGACPESALVDSAETPSLRFIERNCVQCGLCVNTCPEDAITLMPRLLLGAESQGGGDAERGRAVQLRALRQALRHEADGRQHARQARAATRCSPAACGACRCAAIAASST